ncbi:MAG: TonB-dependent receptor [Prevotella sp.]|nr:TonB-dependent receptor [Prevotella sp.]
MPLRDEQQTVFMRKYFSIAVAWTIVMLLSSMPVDAQQNRKSRSQMKDSVMLDNVVVVGKSKTQQLREGAYTVNAIDVKSMVNALSNLNSIIDRTAGVKVREEGGVGSDFDLSINGMSGNAVRYFLDGLPLDTKGSGVTLANLPVNLIDHIEIYKGVVPTWLSSDALGGAVNIVTNRKKSNYLDASYGIGSFHTHKADINSQYILKNGLTIRPTFGINYSKNDYMMKDVEVWDENAGRYLPNKRRRFHDGYFSLLGQLEVGFSDKWWTDDCFITLSYNKVNKELQTNQVQNHVIGMAERQNQAWSIGARYKKNDFLIKKLSANFSLSHTWDHSIVTDTAHRKYDWNGEWIRSARNEINGRAFSQRHVKRPLTVFNSDLNYRFTDQHLLNLSYALNRTENNRWDEVDETFEAANDIFAKHIIGLAYNQSLLKGHMYNTFFLKDYINQLKIKQTDLYFITGSQNMAGSNTQNSIGGGVGSRFEINPSLAVKASYEHSVRLPLARELLGNGTTIYANTALKPEESNNINLGLFGTFQKGLHSLYYEVNGFMRFVDNYIQPQISDDEGYLQYVNEPAVSIKGLEGELRYDWDKRLQVVANMSWQDARDNNRYKDDGKPSVTYKNHVPNRPWLFASAEARYSFHDLLTKTDKLTLGMDYQWVHWFYLSWEAYGLPETKARIPEKNLIGAYATYTWHNNRYGVSLNCQDILDQTVYDNYKLQKPGRSLFLKFRVLFN